MVEVSVTRSPDIKTSDAVMLKGITASFGLEDKNNAEREFIVLYMYVLPKFPSHGIKVGMTKCKMGETFWHAIQSRIKAQEHELALTKEQYNKYGLDREVVYWGICVDAHSESFKDYHIHKSILEQQAGLIEKEQEWFINTPVDELIDIFEKYRQAGLHKDIYEPRKEQRACIDAIKTYFDEHPDNGRFLLNCKMRFGKSYTTYKYCEEADIDKILILTFIPAVESSWQEDISHVEKEYDYYTNDNLKKPYFDPALLDDPFVMFLSLQNYLGRDRNTAETKEKIQKLRGVKWDLVILDEYHFGAWNERTQGTLEKSEDMESEYQQELKKLKDVLGKFQIKTRKTLCLSGTPFKAIDKGEFTKENTFTYSYFDEQKNKYPNSENDDFTTVDPKYAHFPDMKIFGYNMSRLFSGMTEDLFVIASFNNKKYFSLNKFFVTKNTLNPAEPCEFVYEKEIKYWLEIIKGNTIYGTDFPYSNQKMKDNAQHTLWLLPTVNAVKAMSALLEQDNFFNRYQIINLSADGVGAGVNALNYLRNGLTTSKNTNKLGSITLTVNKLTTGVTVKEWSSAFMLKDLESPEQYFQSIFRIQTPFVENGVILKKYGYVYDFNIDRAAALLLKYTEKSVSETVTKLKTAQLIVKYLPIFINGNMQAPIGQDVFYELAADGDPSGKPLSKRITDTAKTTRLMDDETAACMLNDPECSEIIKRVFAHAKLKKSKSQTPAAEPENGFNKEVTVRGREKGYAAGKADYKKYTDYDDESIQQAFENNLASHIVRECPNDLDDEQTVWWTNGYKQGYHAGVEAPIRKMKCGEPDGKEFVEEIQKHLGKNVIWTDSTKSQILNIVNKHLNNDANIPEKYKGALYKNWYCKSFTAAVKKELVVKVSPEEGKSMEDADNTLRHILARLFEFLYISVYRETTFKEIFDNADPDVFLGAVGITKNDFNILNKYHVFQENYLNGLIHQFFVNEQLGSKLNLEDEEVKRQYRNSFGWFGFGLGYEPPVDTEDDDEDSAISTEIEISTISEPGQIKSLLDEIVEILRRNPDGLKSAEIAKQLNVTKKSINRILYNNINTFDPGDKFLWKLR